MNRIEAYLGRIHEGDCLDVMRQMPAESIDVIVTSPPYNLLNSTGNGMRRSNYKNPLWANNKLEAGYEGHDDCMPHEQYVAWQRECLAEMWRLLAPTGAIFYNHKWRVQAGLLQDRADIMEGFPVRQIIIWNRGSGMNFNRTFFIPTYEVIYLLAKPGFQITSEANGWGDIWTIMPARDNEHPAPFPLELPDRCIYSTQGQVVLDPFMGSGTTAIAAINNGRD